MSVTSLRVYSNLGKWQAPLWPTRRSAQSVVRSSSLVQRRPGSPYLVSFREWVGMPATAPSSHLLLKLRAHPWRAHEMFLVSAAVHPPRRTHTASVHRQFGRRASVHRLVASSTANTAARSALSLISDVPVIRMVSRPPSPCTATKANSRSNASTILAPSSAIEDSVNSRSSTPTDALAAPSTRLRGVSE